MAWRDPDSEVSRFKSPTAQRIVSRTLAGDQADQNTQIQQQADESERIRKQQEDQQAALAKQQQRDAQEAQARQVRAADAAGAEIQTDIETGRRTVATHPDGATKFKPGPLGTPVESTTINRELAAVPVIGEVVSSGALGRPAAHTGSEMVQQYQDDRGQRTVQPLPSQTDPKTAEIHQDVENPATGLKERRVIGVDTGLKAQLEQKAKLEGEQAVLDLTRNRHLQEKAAFDPQWQPVKSEYDDAESEVKKLANPETRYQREGQAWIKINEETGARSLAGEEEVRRHKQRWEQAQGRLNRAKTAYEPLRSRADGLEQREREMEMRRLQLGEQKMRLENPGLPEDDGGASSILAKSSGMVDSLPHEQTVAAVAGSGDDGFVGPPQPLLRPDFNPEAIKAAFVGLKDIDGLEIEPRESFSAINKGNEWVGNIERSDGTPLIVVREEARSTGDVGKLISFGQTKGVPVYARESAERKPLKDEAAEVATVFSALADPALRDESGNYLPAFGQRIQELGATPEQIKARVDGGTLSVQHGEALLKAFGDTLVASDPEDPAVRRQWLEERSRAENEALRKRYGDPRLQARNTPLERDAEARSGTSFSLADQNQLNIDYLSDQYVQNRGKPGVSRRKIQALMAKDSADSASTGEKLASMATAARNIAVNDVAGSMFGLAAGAVKDVGAAEAALFGNADAQKELAESIGLRNRDLASWTDSAKRNIKIWTSKDAAAVSQEFEAATKDFQRTIDEEEDAGRPPDQAKIAAAQQRVGAAAMAMHGLAPDEAWPITEDDVDPDKNGALGLALARYKLNADPREFALFKERLLMGNGRRQFSAEMEKKLRANTLGRFGQSVTGGMYAGWQEVGSEMVADAAIAFTGGASKAAQLALRGAGAVGKAERIGALSVRFAEGIDKLAQVGIKAESLVDPLTRMDRARNAVARGVKTAGLGFVGEGSEGALSDLGSDSPDLLSAFVMEGLGGLMLTPAFIPLERAGAAAVERSNEGKLRADNQQFASKYNATMAGTTGFTPISADTAATARLFRSPEQFAESAQRIEQARGEFVQYASAPEPDAKAEAQLTGLRSRISEAEKVLETVPPERAPVVERELAAMREREAVLAADAGEAAGGTEGKMRALRNLTDALDQEAMETESVVAAASELEGVTDPARRTFLSGVAKVATGNTNALTSTERQAVQGARTESGAPFFANVGGREVVTDEGRVEILSNHPAIGALIQTPESQAIFEALTNPTPAINENPIPTEVPPVDMPVPAVQPGDAGAAPQGDPAARPLDVEPGGGDQSGGVRDGGTDAVQGGGVRTGDPGGAAGSGPDPQGTTGGDAPAGDGGAAGAQPGAAGDGSTPQTENEAGSAPVEQETQTERPAVKTAYEAVQRAIVEMPSLSGRFKIDPGTATGQTAGAYATQDGIVLNLGDLEAELSAIPEGDHQARVDAVIHEEIVHFAQFEAVRRAGDEVTAFYGGLWNEFTPEQQKAAAETYQAGFDGMDDWAKAAEAVRMLIQQRSTGQVTELTKAFSKNMPERLLELLRNAVQVLKSFVTDGAIPQRVQEAIDGIEGILAEWQQESREEGGFQVETTGDTARISRDGQRLWEGPAADVNVQMEKLRDEEYSPMRLSGLAIRAASEANPKLRGKLRRQLEGLTEDIADAIGNLPAEERRGALDAAIAEWVEERSAPKSTQRTIDVPARSRAYQALNSGDYPALSAVFQSGTKIMPRPNLISLVQARKRSGARLTNREVELLRNNPEYDGAVFQNQFANSGPAKVAREIVGMIVARQGEGTRPDVVAGYLGEGVTADEMWQRVGAELNAIANGTGLAGTELDPNRERTDAEIATELRNSDQSQLSKVERQEENFREANVQTDDSSPIYVEDFTPESVGGTVTVDGEEMRITAVNMDSLGIEVESVVLDDHLRFGRQVLENGEAVYAEAPPVEEGALFSSPSSGSIRTELLSAFNLPPARYEFRPSDETRPAILEIAAANHISLVQSADLDRQTQRFSERTGASPFFYQGGQTAITGFVPKRNPELIFINADRSDVPIAWTLAHELVHVAQKDPRVDSDAIRRTIAEHLTDVEFRALENNLLSRRYRPDELATEIPAFLTADAVTQHEDIGLAAFARGEELRAALIAHFDELPFLKPESLTDVSDDDLGSSGPADRNRKGVVAEGNGGGQGIGPPALSSSPTPDTQAAVETALAVMQPIYRKVYEAVSAGATPAEVVSRFKITEKAVENILNAVRSRITAATSAAAPEGIKPQMRDGKFDGGRPDLALSTNRIVAGVDQMRNESGVPDVRSDAEVFAAAGQMLSEGYDTTYDRILEKARNLEPLSDVETEAAKRIIARETLEGRAQTAEERVKAAMLIHGYRDIGTEAARALRMRRDPHHSPAERFTQFIAEAQFSPPTETRERMRTAPKKDQQAILQGWLARVDSIKAELRSQGLDIDAAMALFAAQKERRKAAEKAAPERAATIETAVAKLTAREKTVIEAIRGGALVSRAAYITGLSNAEVLQINGKFVKSVKDAMRKTAKQFVENSLAASPVDPLDSILAEFGIYDNALIDDTKSDFKDRRNEKLRRVSEPKKEKADAPAPPTSEQQAKWDKLAEEFFARPMSSWRTLWQDEMKKLDPVNGKNFDFKEADLIQPWKDLWQKEMPGVAWAEPQFKEWAGADATRKQAVMDLFRAKLNELRGTWTKDETRLNPELLPESSYRGEINETTGTFDIHDPVAVKRVIDAFALARGSKMDALVEFWRASILTGPQTHIVNAGSGGLNASYNLLPRRAVEATINNLLGLVGQGSDRAATFAEFAPMARNLRKGFQLAARNAVRSWQLESRTFEAYARAESIQLDFTGVGSEYIPPALGGKIGKIMHSLSFRAMTSADEFIKSLYAQLEAAAQAHRIAAVEEKLTGKAYDARLTELMEPGSVAWIRAIDEAKRVTFQEEINGADPRSIRRLDQLAELAKKGRNMPWIGRPLTFFLPFIDTPLNVFKQAVEMSPIGGALAVIDGARALHRRVRRGDLTKEQAAGDAAKLYDRARFVRDLTNQTIGVAAFIALQGLVVPDEDDEDGLPVMTGTVPYKSTKRGERDNAYAVMPPMTIRIPVLNLQFSYARIEPFATFGASMVDLLVEGNRHGGVLKPEVASQWLSRFKDQVKDKTFLQGVSDLLNAVEDPDRFAERLTANIVTGFLPNFIRQPIRESDSKIRDSNPKADDGFFTAVSKRIGYSIIPMAAPAKTDVWGNDIPSNRGELIGGFQATDAFFRVLDPTNAQLAPKIDPLDRWIFLYNLRTADSADRVAVQPMSNSVRGQVPGEQKMRTFPLTAQEQADANRQAGRAARALLGDGWQDAEMTTLNAKRIRDAVAEAQSSIREQIREKKIAGALAGP